MYERCIANSISLHSYIYLVPQPQLVLNLFFFKKILVLLFLLKKCAVLYVNVICLSSYEIRIYVYVGKCWHLGVSRYSASQYDFCFVKK